MNKKTSWSILKLKLKDIFQRKFSLIIHRACRQVITQCEQSQSRKTETLNKIIFQFDKLKQQENHHHQTFIFIFYSHFSAHHSRSWWKLWFLFIFAVLQSLLCGNDVHQRILSGWWWKCDSTLWQQYNFILKRRWQVTKTRYQRKWTFEKLPPWEPCHH